MFQPHQPQHDREKSKDDTIFEKSTIVKYDQCCACKEELLADMKQLVQSKEQLLVDLQKARTETGEVLDVSQYYCTRESQISVKSENRDQKRAPKPETDQELEEQLGVALQAVEQLEYERDELVKRLNLTEQDYQSNLRRVAQSVLTDISQICMDSH
jgi:hypothetical protein